MPFPLSREMACSPHFVQVHKASKVCGLKLKGRAAREQASFICAKHQIGQPVQPGQCLTFVEICLKLPRDALTHANLVVADIIQAIPNHVARNHGRKLSRQTVIAYEMSQSYLLRLQYHHCISRHITAELPLQKLFAHLRVLQSIS